MKHLIIFYIVDSFSNKLKMCGSFFLTLLKPCFVVHSPGVDFIKVGHMAQIIEIALSICAPTAYPQRFEYLFTGEKFFRKGVGHKKGL